MLDAFWWDGSLAWCFLDVRQRLALSGSHRSTHIASDLASRALASHARLQRESESQAFCIARSQRTRRFFASQANIEGFSQKVFLACCCDFRSSECVLASLAKKHFRFASDLGVCDRIAHRGCIARFGPLRTCISLKKFCLHQQARLAFHLETVMIF